MIISRTPFRISFFGGGTDYPAWYRKYGGQVLSTTIDKYCYINCRYLPPFFEHRYRIVYSKIENVGHYDEIQHPAVRAILGYLNCVKGLEIHHDGDLPARAGLGSSSSFTVGLLCAIHALHGEYRSAHELGSEAIHVEQEIIKESVGSQDQVAVAHGGFNKIEFLKNGKIEVHPVIIQKERISELQNNLMLFFTGLSRHSLEIEKRKIQNIDSRTEELEAISSHVDEAIDILNSKKTSLNEFGNLLNETWERKKRLSDDVSNREIDGWYEKAVKAGGIGGKILGAGGGGFLLMYVPQNKQQKVRDALSSLTYVPFCFEQEGARIVLYNPDQGIHVKEKN